MTSQTRSPSKVGALHLVLVSGLLLSAAAPMEAGSGRPGYRGEGRYAKPAWTEGKHVQQGVGTRIQQPRHLVQPPYFSNTMPRSADPRYPSGVPRRGHGTTVLGHVPFVPWIQLFPLTHERVVYVPVEAERRAPQPVIPNVSAEAQANGPVVIVMQPQEEQAPVAPPPRRQRPVAIPSEQFPVERPRGPGRLELTVAPSDAEVYLDGRFLGAGAEVDPREVPSGVYYLEVKHPDHRTERLFFGVPAQGGVMVEVDLADTRSRRRSWIQSTN